MGWSTCLVVWSVYLVTHTWAQSIYISENAFAEQGKDVQLTCQLELKMPWNSNVYIYRTDTQDERLSSHVAVCHHFDCLQSAPRVVAISDGQNVFVNITKLNRNEDEKYWTCRSVEISVQLFLIVYTTPTDALLTSSLTYPHSLSVGPISMDCSTNSCTYKDPVFKWYIVMGNGSQQLFNGGTIASTVDSSSCTNSEKVYHNTLSLQQNMTFQGNIDMTVQFICGISFSTLVDDLLSTPTGNLTFAVQVTHVQLYDESQEMIDGNQVVATVNVPYSITCVPGPSRPPPIYVFYIAANKISESKSNKVTFIPTRSQHGMKIYCKAYNLQDPYDAVVSNKPLLFVEVPVTSVVLKDGVFEPNSCSNINTTEESPKTLTCVAGESRPSPVYIWYIDSQVRQNHTNGIFTFMPLMIDHERRVYCTAHNLKGYRAVVSLKPRLYVVGRPVQPRIFIFTGSRGTNATFYWIAGFNGGFRQRFILQYRKLKTNDWRNVTETMEDRTTNNLKIPSNEYRTQIMFAPGEYQARLIASNINGETIPVNILDSTFQIMSDDERETSSSHTSFTTPIIGAVLGTMNVVLLGIIIFQCVWAKRKQKTDVPQTTFKLEETRKSQVIPGGTYEELGPTTEATRSTYDTLDSNTLSPTNPLSQEYENTTVG